MSIWKQPTAAHKVRRIQVKQMKYYRCGECDALLAYTTWHGANNTDMKNKRLENVCVETPCQLCTLAEELNK